MRLIVSFLALVITALDYRYGRPGTVLHIAGLAAGIALAFSVVIDHLRPDPAEARQEGTEREPQLESEAD